MTISEFFSSSESDSSFGTGSAILFLSSIADRIDVNNGSASTQYLLPAKVTRWALERLLGAETNLTYLTIIQTRHSLFFRAGHLSLVSLVLRSRTCPARRLLKNSYEFCKAHTDKRGNSLTFQRITSETRLLTFFWNKEQTSKNTVLYRYVWL